MPGTCVVDNVLCLVADALLERAKDSDGGLSSHGVMRLVARSRKERSIEELQNLGDGNGVLGLCARLGLDPTWV